MERRVTDEYLYAVLADFSGYIAADELYDGPFSVFSIVGNCILRRITYEALAFWTVVHTPLPVTEMRRWVGRFLRSWVVVPGRPTTKCALH